MKKTSLLLIGSYGAGNIGDEVLLEIIEQELSSDEFKVTVLSGNLADTKARHPHIQVAPHLPFGWRSFFKTGFKESFRAIKEADVVLLGGGGLITDQESLKAVLLWAWHAFWAKLLKKRFFIVSNSIDPFKTVLGRLIGKWILKQASFISVRDADSYNILKKLYPTKKTFNGSDPAFLYPFPKSTEYLEKNLAFNIRPWKKKIPDLEKWLSQKEEEGWNIHLIATDTRDLKVLRPLINASRKLHQPKNYQELSEILGTCQLAIGMRLHFLIAASCMHCKVAALAYSPKVESLMEAIEIPFLLPKEWEFKSLEKVFKEAAYGKRIGEQKTKAKASFEVLRKALV
jgi:polysaccharide pyruvyl transferase CsaB